VTVLSDRELSALYPSYEGAIGPASIDLHLGSSLLVWPDYVRRNPRIDQRSVWHEAEMVGEGWVLKRGIRYLAATRERLVIPVNLAGQIAARSSWGRDGLSVICGPAGWIDPGYQGHPTLELSVIGSDLEIWPGAAICQLVLHTLTSAAEHPYAGRYQGDAAPTPSRSYREVAL
jgi:dCTP deaminase